MLLRSRERIVSTLKFGLEPHELTQYQTANDAMVCVLAPHDITVCAFSCVSTMELSWTPFVSPLVFRVSMVFSTVAPKIEPSSDNDQSQ